MIKSTRLFGLLAPSSRNRDPQRPTGRTLRGLVFVKWVLTSSFSVPSSDHREVVVSCTSRRLSCPSCAHVWKSALRPPRFRDLCALENISWSDFTLGSPATTQEKIIPLQHNHGCNMKSNTEPAVHKSHVFRLRFQSLVFLILMIYFPIVLCDEKQNTFLHDGKYIR